MTLLGCLSEPSDEESFTTLAHAIEAGQGGAASCVIDPISEASPFDDLDRTPFVPETGEHWTTRQGTSLGDIDVPVCWARSAFYGRAVDGTLLPSTPGVETLMRWVSESVHHTWSRNANIYFHWLGHDGTFWPCADDAASKQIVVGFADAPNADYGSFTARPTRVLLPGNLKTREEVWRAAFDLFGRALRLIDAGEAFPASETATHLLTAQTWHGMKPPGALSSSQGHCLVAAGLTGPAVTLPFECHVGSVGLPWQPAERQGVPTLVQTASEERCFLPFEGNRNALRVAPCSTSMPAAIEIRRAQWKALGGLCVSVPQRSVGAELVIADCSHATRWDFDFKATERIRLSDSEPCLAVAPAAANVGAALTLRACDDAMTTLTLASPYLVQFAPDRCAQVVSDAAGPNGLRLLVGNCIAGWPLSSFSLSWRMTQGTNCATVDFEVGLNNWVLGTSRSCSDSPEPTTPYEPNPFEWDYHW